MTLLRRAGAALSAGAMVVAVLLCFLLAAESRSCGLGGMELVLIFGSPWFLVTGLVVAAAVLISNYPISRKTVRGFIIACCVSALLSLILVHPTPCRMDF